MVEDIMNTGDTFENDCDCGECESCLEKDGKCTCGECLECLEDSEEVDLVEDLFDDVEAEDMV